MDLTVSYDMPEGEKKALIQYPVAPIKSEQDYTLRMNQLGEIKDRRKRVEKWFEDIKRPINDARNSILAKEREVLEPIRAKEREMDRICVEYFVKQNTKVEEKTEKVMEKHEQKVQEAVDKGKDPASVVMPVLPSAPAKSIGGSQIKTVKSWRIKKSPSYTYDVLKGMEPILRSDPLVKEFPDHWFVLDLSKARAAAAEGTSQIVEQYDKPITASR